MLSGFIAVSELSCGLKICAQIMVWPDLAVEVYKKGLA